jgi:TPR repeat protein
MAIVFISFALKDRNVATTICDALEHRGVSCWIATRDIAPGENFQTSVYRAIRAAKVMVLIFSGNSNNSDEIKKEVVLAGQSRLIVIPVRVEDVTPDGAFAYELATRQWIDLFDDWEHSVQRLVGQVATIVGTQPVAAPFAAPPPVPPAAVPDAAALSTQPARAPEPAVAPPPQPVRASEPMVAASPPQPARTTPASKNNWAAIGGIGGFAFVAIGAAIWFWSGGFGARPPPPPPIIGPATVNTAEALTKGKAAFDRMDYVEAIRWYRPAADQGNAEAETYIGYLYEKGFGVTKDYAEALRWYRKAADQGRASAQRNIGNFYEQGLGVPRDYSEAMRWYRQAADQGNAGAQTNTGYLYEHGLGVTQNYLEALRWYRMAADHGQATAQNNIGVFYDKGYGVTQNYGEALRWYRMAADQGNIDAEYNLALLYANGHGVPPDLGQARQWMQKAADAGDPEAKKWLGNNGG